MSFDEQDWNRPVMGSGARDTVLERRSLMENDNGVVAPDAPPAFYTAIDNKGKFFPRGCRGMIQEIHVYCRGAIANGIQIYLGPHPGVGIVQGVAITPVAGWTWAVGLIHQMWNYDSLFVWVQRCDAGVDYGYDTAVPYDAHHGDASDAYWNSIDQRLFIRVVYAGETVGDVPVSGTVNTVHLPSSNSYSVEVDKAVAIGVNTMCVAPDIIGYCDYIKAVVNAAPNSEQTMIRVYTDDVLAMEEQFLELNTHGHTTSTPTVSLSTYLEDGLCVMLIHKRFEFQHRLAVYAFNAVAVQTVTVTVHPNTLT